MLNNVELEILKTKGKKALLEYRKKNRILSQIPPKRVIESKKYKKKYKDRREKVDLE